MPSIGKGTVEVVYDKAQAEKAARDAIIPGLGRVADDMVHVFAGKKVFDFAKQGFAELGEAQKVSAQTATIVKNLGSAAGVTVDEVDALSKSMLAQSGVDDELAKSAENTLLRLGVQGDTFKRATQDSNDLSQSFGDMQSNAELLGKALAHPEQAARLLKPAIGGLTDAQLESIKAFEKQGDAADAQNVILDAVEAKVGGAAKAFGETLPGQEKIAEESLKNMKAELVAGMAPALTLGAKGVTFLTEEFDKLPPSAQTVIGTTGLVSAGIISLAKPVGDIARLYQTWRQRSEEVAAAQEALALAEANEAAASAAGAVSSASASAVTVAGIAVSNDAAFTAAKRVVSNEAIAFSDDEIVAAEQARQLAEMQSLISNDALIAGDAELVAANEAAAASAAEYAAANGAAGGSAIGLATGLGLAIGVVGIAAGVYSAVGDALGKPEQATADYTAAILKNTGALSENIDTVTATKIEQNGAADLARQAEISYTSLFESVRTGTEDWGKYGRAVMSLPEAESQGALGAKNLGLELRAAGADQSEFGRQLIAGVESGKLNQAEVQRLIKDMEGLHNGYGLGTQAASRHKEVTDAVAAATKDASGGTLDQARSLSELRAGLDDATISTGDLSDAEQTELKWADAASKARENSTGLINDLSAAMDRSYQSTLKNQSLTDTYASSINALEDSLKKNGTTLDVVADKTGRYNDKALANQAALAATGDSIAKLIEKRFEETHSVDDAIAVGQLYVDNLGAQLKAAGYNKTQIADMIDTMHLTPDQIRTTFSNNAVEQQIVVGKYLQQLKDLPESQRTALEAEINQGQYDTVSHQLDDLAAGRNVNFYAILDPGSNRILPGTGHAHAAGGPVGPGEVFRGAEQGFEILLHDGIYQAPPAGGFVLPHDQSSDFITATLNEHAAQQNDSSSRRGHNAEDGPSIYALTHGGNVIMQEPQDMISAFRRLELLSGGVR